MTDPLDELSQAASEHVSAQPIRIPNYQNILIGVKKLNKRANTYAIWGWILMVLGIVGIIATAGLAIANIIRIGHIPDPATMLTIVLGVTFPLASVLLAMTMFFIASMIRLVAELSIAQRDIAMNSFRALSRK